MSAVVLFPGDDPMYTAEIQRVAPWSQSILGVTGAAAVAVEEVVRQTVRERVRGSVRVV